MTQPSQPLFTYFSKSNVQIRDDLLRTEKNGLASIGIPEANLGQGADSFTRATALSNELAVVHANAVIKADENMPDTAKGPGLDRWLRAVGLSRRGPIPAFGLISAPCSAASTSVPSDAQLTDSSGNVYNVQVGGIFVTADTGYITVPVIAAQGGAATNHENGDALEWVSAPPFCAQQVLVGTIGGTDGLSNGFDSEQGVDEPPRQRLFQTLQNPPRAGNAADVAKWCTDSTPSVQAGFVYPALLGPGTTFVAIVGQAQTVGTLSSTSKDRDLPAPLVNAVVAPFVRGQYPENTQSVFTSAANQADDIAILLALPPAGTASPPGPGGGWLDGSPWPNSVGGTTPALVGTVTSSKSFTVVVPSSNPPQAGVSRIAFISPLDWKLYKATVLTVGVYAGGAFPITVDTPMVGIAAGNFIFPQSVNQQLYADAVLAAFAGLGPGEWTSASSTLVRAFRHPRQSLVWPSVLDARFLKQVENSSPEVESATWLYRQFSAPDVPASITVDPTTGLLTSAPPNILVPRNIAFYAA